MGFFNQEKVNREQLGYPPFGKLLRILVVGEKEEVVRSAIMGVSRLIRSRPVGEFVLLGPSPAAFSRIKNNFRYSLLLKSKSVRVLQELATLVRKNMAKPPKGIRIAIDVDPMNML